MWFGVISVLHAFLCSVAFRFLFQLIFFFLIKVEELCNQVREAWTDLNEKATVRAHKLELSLKAQQYFFDANEVESWLNEKGDVLSSTDYGRDRDSATKWLTKHKGLELELDTYNSIIVEMGCGAQALIASGHPESKAISERQATLEHLVRSLQRRAAVRQHRLMESLFRHEYFSESSDLERWISEQQQQAASEDYGQDYEHLLVIKTALRVAWKLIFFKVVTGKIRRFQTQSGGRKRTFQPVRRFSQKIDCQRKSIHHRD